MPDSSRFGGLSRAATSLAQQIPDNFRRSFDGSIDLCLVFSAGLGQLRLTTARSAHQLGHSTYQLACLDALDEPRRNTRNQRHLALRLRGCNQHYSFAGLLLQIVNQRTKLTTIERVGAKRDEFYAFH